MKLSVFHTPKPKQFSYKPVYSNERSEDKKLLNPDTPKPIHFSRISERKATSKGANIKYRMYIYAAVALFLIYYIFFK